MPSYLSQHLSKVIKATKDNKKDILRFYKSEHYAARFIGHDQSYFIKEHDTIIANVIFSGGIEANNSVLLHGLVVAQAYRSQGIASLLLKESIIQMLANSHIDTIVCFAELSLKPFYFARQFAEFDITHSEEFARHSFLTRFLSYKKKHHDLCCFTFNNLD